MDELLNICPPIWENYGDEFDFDTDLWLRELASQDINSSAFNYEPPAIPPVPLYKLLRPPPLHFAPARGGSTYPGDIPIFFADVNEFCWTDMLGRLHVNMIYGSEEEYPYIFQSQAISIKLPATLSTRTFTMLVNASRNRTTKHTVIHAKNQETGEFNTMGEFFWCTDETHIIDKVYKAELVFVQLSTPNQISSITQAQSVSFVPRIIADCCLGCSAGVGCFRCKKRARK